MSIEDDDIEAAIAFPRHAKAMVELVRKCHGSLGQFARLEAERLRHQERANKEAVINCALNDEIDRIQDAWREERKSTHALLREIRNSWHAQPGEIPGMWDRLEDAICKIDAVVCLPNVPDDRAGKAGSASIALLDSSNGNTVNI